MRRTAFLALAILFASCIATTERPSGQALYASFDDRIDELLAQMTLDEKVGQMTQPDQEFLEDVDHVRKYMVGSLLSGGGSDPVTNSLEDWRALYEMYQSKALETRLGIPLLYGVDAVHGHSNVIGAAVFPHNIGLGATRNAELVEEIARITAKEVKATGMNWGFAPCVAVPRDDRWGRTYEGFAEEPALVAELGAAAVRGLQGTDLSDSSRVIACAKHLVGDGGTVINTGVTLPDGSTYPFDRGDVPLTEEELRRIHLEGYVTAVAAGVGTIMPSYSSWNGVKCSGSRRLLTEIVKEELGFEGFLISDFKAIDELPGDYKSDIETSINAGMDMVMVPDRYQLFFDTLKELVEEGAIPMERIDDAVRRILRVKFAAGLFDDDWSPTADRSLEASFGSDEHRAVARQAVRESMVLLKNEDDVLPLAKDAGRIHVVGPGADDIGMQSGGWTIDWQGKMGAITEGTTILDAIKKAVAEATTVTHSENGTGAEGADVVVVVVGERPYAEMYGDDLDLELSDGDRAVVANAAAAGVPVVTLLISGRPLVVKEALEASDAFVAIWLPGTEGDGIADVLFGDYAPTGKLSFSWPRSADQHPVNVGDEDYDPLFAFGYGLSW
ncbi:MAG: glycoside hydrolase family 3 C-terminal domain-containing protein [Gemmatimonadota bacterium]|nr:glycoside hydrolase family 3 C-terminal domain-containing protein [Gemmatimonadota bacterium]